MHPNLKTLLGRSEELHADMGDVLAALQSSSQLRVETCLNYCTLSVDYAMSLRILMASEHPTPATGLMRFQFESLVKGFWFYYNADDELIAKLNTALASDSRSVEKKLPALRDMLKQLEANLEMPRAALARLRTCEQTSLDALHSYAHGGIHAFSRHKTGFPEQLALQIIQSSNALCSIAGMFMALMSEDEQRVLRLLTIYDRFSICFPLGLPPATS